MKIRKNTLWRVPLFCLVAGVIAFYVVVFFLSRLAIVRLSDGTITLDNTKILIIYGAILIVSLIVGRAFFRNITRKEVFFSASIVVVIGLIIIFTQLASGVTTGSGAVFFMYAARIFEWSGFIPQLLYRVNGSIWLGAFVNCLTPYVFIPFGKKEQEIEGAQIED